MEMIPCFTDVLHVPNLSTAEHLLAVIRESGVSSWRWKRLSYLPHLSLQVIDETGLAELARSLGGRKANIGMEHCTILMSLHFEPYSFLKWATVHSLSIMHISCHSAQY